MDIPLPCKFRTPSVERNDDFSDFIDRLDTFRVLMQLQGAPDAIMCRAFAANLKRDSKAWYRTLKPDSIRSLSEMELQLIGRFASNQKIAKTLAHLMSQKETLKDFIHHFVNATLEILNLGYGVAVVALTTTFQLGDFLNFLGKKPLVNMGGLMM
ncbi:uncharacterized protein LOC131151286 [Malania oleifera]|uniref:uncharacterized protein LOC131151286 n=1 Tax=Malania oleifera TaxID=397392 RepID=UPI0025AE2985|nr:uncharacterized protein LOC131151286 [Malania oleifera]